MESLIKVRSVYCVQYISQWQEDNEYFIQMELCSDSLKTIVGLKPQAFGRQTGEPMNSIEFYISCQISREICECVQYLHELNPQIIHGDLKPDNILITRTPINGRFIKVSDFGLASIYRGSGRIHSQCKGTARYMAPEVRLMDKYTTIIDVYSLAIIAKELFDLLYYE